MRLTLQQFVNQWNGKHLEFDGAYAYQCVDLTKAWQSNLGLSITRGNAKDWQYTASRKDYTWIPNSITAVAKSGDIVIFDKGLFGRYGHIGVCTSANALNITCFEQNNPIGSVCRNVYHPMYRGVVGWLRPHS